MSAVVMRSNFFIMSKYRFYFVEADTKITQILCLPGYVNVGICYLCICVYPAGLFCAVVQI